MSKKIANEENQKMCCGLVMPISSIDGCNEQHWLDVKDILTESIESSIKYQGVSQLDFLR